MIRIILIFFLFLFQCACLERHCQVQVDCEQLTEEECWAFIKKAKADCEKGK